MPTDISPSLGQGAVFLQAGPGSSPGYSAIDVRRAAATGLQEGAIDSGSYKVSQRAAGANMSVDVAANSGSGAYVQGDDVGVQGLYYVAPHSAVINETISAADATNPRVDQVILEVEDDTHDSSTLNKARVRVVAGTATSGATLDNRSGAAALPNGAMRLADVLVPAASTSVTSGNIRDRRPWARGANFLVTRTSGDITRSTTTMTRLDTTNMEPRIECSGNQLAFRLLGNTRHTTAGGWVAFSMFVDGADLGLTYYNHSSGADAQSGRALLDYLYAPTAGSHTFAPAASASAATGTISANAAQPLIFHVREIVAQSASNS